MNIPPELAEQFARGDGALFVGAGLSMGAGLPGWVALIRPLAEAVGYHLPSDDALITPDHLLTAAQHYANQRGLNALIRHFNDQLDTHPQLTAIHRLIATLPVNVIFTTNYDDLIERALTDAGKRKNVIVSESELAFWSEDSAQVVKLCGNLGRPQSLVITKSQFNTYAAQHPRLAERLRSTLESKAALFLGYSLQDPFFNQIWDNIGLNFGDLRRFGYAALFDAELLETDDLNKRRGIQVINLQTEGRDRTALLAEWLEALKAEVDRGNPDRAGGRVTAGPATEPSPRPAPLNDSVVAVLDANDRIVGTGFVASGLILTCAHVIIAAGGKPGGTVNIRFHANGEGMVARGSDEMWRAPEDDDVAVLSLDGDLPQDIMSLPLGDVVTGAGHPFRAFGYPTLKGAHIQGLWATGKIEGLVRDSAGRQMLQLSSPNLAQGISGGPVLDEATGRVVGMVTAVYHPDVTTKHRDTGFATPVETLRAVCPALVEPNDTIGQEVAPVYIPNTDSRDQIRRAFVRVSLMDSGIANFDLSIYRNPPFGDYTWFGVRFKVQNARISMADKFDSQSKLLNLVEPVIGVHAVHFLINAGDGRKRYLGREIGSINFIFEQDEPPQSRCSVTLGKNVREWAIGNFVEISETDHRPEPLVDTVKDDNSHEAWRGQTHHGQVAVMDLLSVRIDATKHSKKLLGIEFTRSIPRGPIALDYFVSGITIEVGGLK